VPKATSALESVPGVLAVNVDYDTKRATVGTERGKRVPHAALLAALEKIGYRGELIEGGDEARGGSP
jgi:copper chaperone CopZ